MLILKVLSGLVAMALGAAVVLLLPGFSPAADAGIPKLIKGDRLNIRPVSQQCAAQTWPYLDPTCLRDSKMGQPRTVRHVTTERAQ